MRRSFWKSCAVFWRFKSLLVAILVGGVISAASFGAGLGMLLPVAQLLLNPDRTLGEQLHKALERDPAAAPDAGTVERIRDAAAERAGGWADAAVAALPADPFWQFVCVLVTLVALTVVGSVGRYVQSAGAQSMTIYAEQWWRERLFRRAIRVPLDQLHADAGAAADAGLSQKEKMRRQEGESKAQRRARKRAEAAAFALKNDGPSGGTSDLIARLTGDVSQMCTGYPVLLSRALEAVLQGVAGLAVAFWLNWKLSLVAMLMAPVLGMIVARFGSRIRRATRSELAFRGSMLLTLTQAFGGLATVKTHNAEGVERRRFHHVQKRILTERLRVRRIKAAFRAADGHAVAGGGVPGGGGGGVVGFSRGRPAGGAGGGAGLAGDRRQQVEAAVEPEQRPASRRRRGRPGDGALRAPAGGADRPGGDGRRSRRRPPASRASASRISSTATAAPTATRLTA